MRVKVSTKGLGDQDLERLTERLLRLVAIEVIYHAGVTPPPPKRPIAWASRKQRAAVMVKLRRYGGPPYRRGRTPTSENLPQAWYWVRKSRNAVIVANRASYAQYVVGLRQQVMHKRTGWITTEQAAERIRWRVILDNL